jgi:uncharacterized metal-binding protein YceD (DUF177 family)
VTKHQAAEPIAAHGFRRLVSASKVGEAGLDQTVEAKPSEFEKIAAYLDLVAVRALTAEISLSRWRDRGVRVTGSLKADVTQSCVVTLDAVEAHVEAEFDRRFLPEETLAADRDAKEILVDPEGDDPAEPLTREIDLGEILIEELSLNLDPYPRKPGVEFQDDDASTRRENPFAVLAKLKPKPGKKGG